jgi:hypothetical protein
LIVTWFGLRQGKEPPFTGTSSRLIADTEVYLSGEYANHLRRHGDTVPGWAQLNQFAHADIETLRRDRRRPSARQPAISANLPEEAWRTAHELLAGEIIELVGRDPLLLSHLQRNILIPLELKLMCERDLTAFELVQFARSALRSTLWERVPMTRMGQDW